MIKHIRELFTKPEMKLSSVDKIEIALIILTIFAIVFTIVLSVYYLVKHIKEKIKERKRNKHTESLNERNRKKD